MGQKDDVIKLNLQDFHFLAMDKVNPAQSHLIIIRFQTRHNVEEIQAAMRYLISIYPKLRSVLVPTLLSYRLKVLDDNDRRIDAIFHASFRVEHALQYDSEKYIEYRRRLFNEPFSLEHGLCIKICFIPDNSHPVLLVSLHHLVADGMGWLHMLDSLLAFLNG